MKILVVVILVIIIVVIRWLSPPLERFESGIKFKSRIAHLQGMDNMAKQVKDKNNCVALMMFNEGHIEEAKNCIQTYRKHIGNNVIVCALDLATKKAMDSLGVKCFYNHKFFPENIKDGSSFSSSAFKKIAYNKILVISKLLKSGLNVLWVDTDIVFMKNPMPYLQKNKKPIGFQNDDSRNSKSTKNLCSGFIYLRSVPLVNKYLDQCVDYVDTNYDKLVSRTKGYADQGVFNKFKNLDIIEVLPVTMFPNGYAWWDMKYRISHRHDAFIVHNNYIVGVDNKIKRFKQDGLWFI